MSATAATTARAFGHQGHLAGEVAGEVCPTCQQPIANDRLAEITSRLQAREREQANELAARMRDQFARERRDAEVKAKAELEVARTEAREVAEAANRQRIADIEAAQRSAANELEQLKASQAVALAAKEVELRRVLEADKVGAVQAEQAKSFEANQRFQAKIAELQRQLENRTAQDLGECAEMDLFETLKAEFPGDRISRVDKGVAGADIVHDIQHNGQICGRIVYDAKNRSAWRNEYVSKLRQDQSDASADHAVLASKVFPAGVKELHVQDGVVIVAPARVLVIAGLLRRQTVQTHALRLSSEARAEKTSALYAFIMSERCAHLLASIETQADDLTDLDRREEKAHQTVWKRRAELIRNVQRSHADLTSEIERIIGTRAP
ncbi:MAG: DUF2130 domain-containing protein [Hyphomicrobium sp.]